MAISRDDQSHIHISKGGTSFVGRDATELFANTMLAVALRAYANTGLLMNRHMKPTLMLKKASRVTGKIYKRGQYGRAADDVKIWCDTMRAALPVTRD